jgi:predicted helicase
MVERFNAQRDRWIRSGKSPAFEVAVDEKELKWVRNTKRTLLRGEEAQFLARDIRRSLYRPFTRAYSFLNRAFNEDLYKLRNYFPSDIQNCAVALTDVGGRSPFSCLAVGTPFDLHLCASTDTFQGFPFYTYDENGSNRRENITDWALGEFRKHYADATISKWEIFHYTYALLHSPDYRERYAANLKRELPRIPYAPDFRSFVSAGKQLADLHVNYEQQPEYSLERIETRDAKLTFRVEKMRLGRDKSSLFYNDFLTLSGIPPETYEYRLGNRSALEWVIDQYQVSTDKRSGITNDPNREDDAEYILRLIGQVIHVSLETVKIVNALPALNNAMTKEVSGQ